MRPKKNTPRMLSSTRPTATTPSRARDSVAALVRLFMAMVDSLPAAALERAEREPEADGNHGDEVEEVARIDHAALHGIGVEPERQPLEHGRDARGQEEEQVPHHHEEGGD